MFQTTRLCKYLVLGQKHMIFVSKPKLSDACKKEYKKIREVVGYCAIHKFIRLRITSSIV